MLQLTNRISILKKNSTIFTNPGSLSQYDLNEGDFDKSYFDNNSNPTPHIYFLNSTGKNYGLRFYFVNSVEIDSSFKNLTKTAKVKLPRNLQFDGIPINKLFNRGDGILIELGYIWKNDNTTFTSLRPMFVGYIVNIGLSTPIELYCEDGMFALKNIQKSINTKVYPDGKLTLTQIIDILFKDNGDYLQVDEIKEPDKTNSDYINPSHKVGDQLYQGSDFQDYIPVLIQKGGNLDIDPFTYSGTNIKSIAEILDELKKKLYIFIYFDDFGNLRFELPYTNISMLGKYQTIYYDEQVIKDNLNFQLEEDVLVKVIFKSKSSKKGLDDKNREIIGTSGGVINPTSSFKSDDTNKDIPSKYPYIGDKDGDSIPVNSAEDMTQQQCNDMGFRVYRSNKYTGFKRGSTITTFGEPVCRVGQSVILDYKDPILREKYKERIGRFAVHAVKRTFDMNGYRQHIELGLRLDSYDDLIKSGKI